MTGRYFDRLEGEKAASFNKFCAYRDQGKKRSLRKLAQELNVSLTSLAQLSKRWDWPDRAAAYDDHLDMTRQLAVEEYEKECALDLVEVRKQTQERLVSAEARFTDKLEQMLEAPVYLEQEIVEEYEDGRPRLIINRYPAQWNYTTVINAFKVMDESPAKRALDSSASEDHQWGKSREDIENDLERILQKEYERGRREALEEIAEGNGRVH